MENKHNDNKSILMKQLLNDSCLIEDSVDKELSLITTRRKKSVEKISNNINNFDLHPKRLEKVIKNTNQIKNYSKCLSSIVRNSENILKVCNGSVSFCSNNINTSRRYNEDYYPKRHS